MVRWGTAALAVVVLLLVALLSGGALLWPERAATPGSSGAPSATPPAATVEPTPDPPAPPLDGYAVVLDPGHQLGNGRHPSRINAAVPDGAGGTKACNTTGTSTDDGYPEATFNWEVAVLVRDALADLGAEVVLTREADSAELWGPCVDERGLAGNDLAGNDVAGNDVPGEVVKVSIHADGSYGGGSGFHVISSPLPEASADVSAEFATVMADALAESFDRADYIAGGDGLDVRSDLATLNHATIPTVLVELGNMRNATEAARMRTPEGQAAYAEALVAGIRAFLES